MCKVFAYRTTSLDLLMQFDPVRPGETGTRLCSGNTPGSGYLAISSLITTQQCPLPRQIVDNMRVCACVLITTNIAASVDNLNIAILTIVLGFNSLEIFQLGFKASVLEYYRASKNPSLGLRPHTPSSFQHHRLPPSLTPTTLTHHPGSTKTMQ